MFSCLHLFRFNVLERIGNALGMFWEQKNSAMAGAITGAALALTSDDSSHEQIVQCAITGAAISTAANLLTGIF